MRQSVAKSEMPYSQIEERAIRINDNGKLLDHNECDQRTLAYRLRSDDEKRVFSKLINDDQSIYDRAIFSAILGYLYSSGRHNHITRDLLKAAKYYQQIIDDYNLKNADKIAIYLKYGLILYHESRHLKSAIGYFEKIIELTESISDQDLRQSFSQEYALACLHIANSKLKGFIGYPIDQSAAQDYYIKAASLYDFGRLKDSSDLAHYWANITDVIALLKTRLQGVVDISNQEAFPKDFIPEKRFINNFLQIRNNPRSLESRFSPLKRSAGPNLTMSPLGDSANIAVIEPPPLIAPAKSNTPESLRSPMSRQSSSGRNSSGGSSVSGILGPAIHNRSNASELFSAAAFHPVAPPVLYRPQALPENLSAFNSSHAMGFPRISLEQIESSALSFNRSGKIINDSPAKQIELVSHLYEYDRHFFYGLGISDSDLRDINIVRCALGNVYYTGKHALIKKNPLLSAKYFEKIIDSSSIDRKELFDPIYIALGIVYAEGLENFNSALDWFGRVAIGYKPQESLANSTAFAVASLHMASIYYHKSELRSIARSLYIDAIKADDVKSILNQYSYQGEYYKKISLMAAAFDKELSLNNEKPINYSSPYFPEFAFITIFSDLKRQEEFLLRTNSVRDRNSQPLTYPSKESDESLKSGSQGHRTEPSKVPHVMSRGHLSPAPPHNSSELEAFKRMGLENRHRPSEVVKNFQTREGWLSSQRGSSRFVRSKSERFL